MDIICEDPKIYLEPSVEEIVEVISKQKTNICPTCVEPQIIMGGEVKAVRP